MYILVFTRKNQGGEINTMSPLPDLSEPNIYTSTPGAVGPSLEDYQPLRKCDSRINIIRMFVERVFLRFVEVVFVE